MSEIIFITGASGIGKTTLIRYLSDLLSHEQYDIHDLDERGVPKDVDENWRMKETKFWVEKAKENLKNNKSTIIIGLSHPDEVGSLTEAKCLFLDAYNHILKERLQKKYQSRRDADKLKDVSGLSVERFIEDSLNHNELLRKLCESCNCEKIDTSELSPDQVANEVAKIIKS